MSELNQWERSVPLMGHTGSELGCVPGFALPWSSAKSSHTRFLRVTLIKKVAQ